MRAPAYCWYSCGDYPLTANKAPMLAPRAPMIDYVYKYFYGGNEGHVAVDKEALKHYVSEQHRFHDELTKANDAIKNKIVAYIGAIFAFLAFIYVGALDATKTVPERLFIPDELYGKIFYAAGLFFILLALGKLIHGSRPSGYWSVGFQSSDLENIEIMEEEEYLVKLKNDNDDARKENLRQYDKSYAALKDAFYPMLLGAIILVVLRYFQ
jgi:hypothetical protein